MWMGFYENAFGTMREVYEYCSRKQLMPGSPFQSYQDAFSPVDVISVVENIRGKAYPWTTVFPETDSWPGEGRAPAGVVDHGTVWVLHRADSRTAGCGVRQSGRRAQPLGRLAARELAPQSHDQADEPPSQWTRGREGAGAGPARSAGESRDAVADMLEGFGSIFLAVLEFVGTFFAFCPELRRIAILLDTDSPPFAASSATT